MRGCGVRCDWLVVGWLIFGVSGYMCGMLFLVGICCRCG